MTAVRNSHRSAVTVIVMVLATVFALASTAQAREDVTPARGFYGWETIRQGGGLAQSLSFDVRRSGFADISTVRIRCAGDYYVTGTYKGKEKRLKIEGDEFTYQDQGRIDGGLVKLSAKVNWVSDTRARGWVKVTGRAGNLRCTGDKTSFRLTYSAS